MLKFIKKFIVFAGISVAASSLICSCGENEFRVHGEILNAKGKTLILQKPGFNGEWISIDSTTINSKNEFSINAPTPQHPEIYRLQLNGQYIYLPVDSSVNLTLETSVADFGKNFSLSGTESAKKMENFEKALAAVSKLPTDTMPGFKKHIFTEIIFPGKGDIMSYYILTRVIDGKPLFDPKDATDAKYYAAVATAYKHYKPNDPRTPMLEKLALSARKNQKAAKGQQNVVQAPTISMIDLEFPNLNGEKIRLSNIAGKGKPTLVIFSMVAQKESPEINREIARLYEKYKNKYNFYEVCLDPDITAWREAVKNIPWTTVIDYDGLNSRSALQYNVSSLPAFFIYNSAGDLTTRADDFASLQRELSK